MKISKKQSVYQAWDEVKSWNYKLNDLSEKYKSVVYAEVKGDHGEVESSEVERVYYIVKGIGEFEIGDEIIQVQSGDVITVAPHTKYNYRSTDQDNSLNIILFMELWDN